MKTTFALPLVVLTLAGCTRATNLPAESLRDADIAEYESLSIQTTDGEIHGVSRWQVTDSTLIVQEQRVKERYPGGLAEVPFEIPLGSIESVTYREGTVVGLVTVLAFAFLVGGGGWLILALAH